MMLIVLYDVLYVKDFPWRQKPVDELTEASSVGLLEAAALVYFTGTYHFQLSIVSFRHSHSGPLSVSVNPLTPTVAI